MNSKAFPSLHSGRPHSVHLKAGFLRFWASIDRELFKISLKIDRFLFRLRESIHTEQCRHKYPNFSLKYP